MTQSVCRTINIKNNKKDSAIYLEIAKLECTFVVGLESWHEINLFMDAGG